MSGEADKTSGKLKQAAGGLTDDEELEAEGEREELAGKAKNALGDMADKAKGAVDSAKDALS